MPRARRLVVTLPTEHPPGQCHNLLGADEAIDDGQISISKKLLNDVISQGCCPVQLDITLRRTLHGQDRPCQLSHGIGLAGFADVLESCTGQIADQLSFHEQLVFRACSLQLLQRSNTTAKGKSLWGLAFHAFRRHLQRRTERECQQYRAAAIQFGQESQRLIQEIQENIMLTQQLVRQNQESSSRIGQESDRLMQLVRQNQEIDRQNQQLGREIQECDRQIQQLGREIQEGDRQVQERDRQIAELRQENSALTTQLRMLRVAGFRDIHAQRLLERGIVRGNSRKRPRATCNCIEQLPPRKRRRLA